MAGAASASPLAQHRARRSADARRQSINHTRVYSDHGFVNTGTAADQQTALTRARTGVPAAEICGDRRRECADVIDRDHLGQQTAQDIDLQRDILNLFVDQLQELCRLLDDAAARSRDGGPDHRLTPLLQSLRGAAAAVGAQALALASARRSRIPGGRGTGAAPSGTCWIGPSRQHAT